MRNFICIILATALIVIIGLILHSNYIDSNCDKTVNFKTKIISVETQNDEFKVQYPVFSEEKLNALVNKFLQDQKDRFEKMKLDQPEIQEIKGKNSVYIEYISSRYNENFISFKFSISQYVLGMAHPNNFVVTKTYDLINLKEIELKELFVDNNYLDQISKLCAEQLISRLDDSLSDLINEGTKPEENNFSNFILDENNLNLIFSPGQVAPYVLGEQEVKIDLTQLQNLLKSEFKANIL